MTESKLTEENLKPCPFCGSDDVVPNQVTTDGGWGVLCRHCHTYQDTRAPSQHVAIAAWNRRTEGRAEGSAERERLEAEYHRRGVKIIEMSEHGGAHLCRAEKAEAELEALRAASRALLADVEQDANGQWFIGGDGEMLVGNLHDLVDARQALEASQ